MVPPKMCLHEVNDDDDPSSAPPPGTPAPPGTTFSTAKLGQPSWSPISFFPPFKSRKSKHNGLWEAPTPSPPKPTFMTSDYHRPAFSLPALLEDGHTTEVFSRESLAADYVVLLFLPMDGRVDTTELAAFRDQVQHSTM